jgi:hypothetical protein
MYDAYTMLERGSGYSIASLHISSKASHGWTGIGRIEVGEIVRIDLRDRNALASDGIESKRSQRSIDN